MKLRSAFDSLLAAYSDRPEADAVRVEIEQIISAVDIELEKLEQTAMVLYGWNIEDLKTRMPVAPRNPASELLRAFHAVKDARLLTAKL